MFVVLTHPVCSTLFRQPEETNTGFSTERCGVAATNT